MICRSIIEKAKPVLTAGLSRGIVRVVSNPPCLLPADAADELVRVPLAAWSASASALPDLDHDSHACVVCVTCSCGWQGDI